MDRPRRRAERIAKRYIGSGTIVNLLGSGAEGFVFSSQAATAIKVFTYEEKFQRELAAYQRLREHDVERVLRFAVPKLVDWDERLLVIEMTMVQPPFLLDFAQARLDVPLDFAESEAEMWVRLSEDFGEHLSEVQELFYLLQSRYGIYYYDLAPRNINFGSEP